MHCQVKVGDLTPTQNAAGFDEVNDKIARYSAKSNEDLCNTLDDVLKDYRKQRSSTPEPGEIGS